MREWFQARYSLSALWLAWGAIVVGYIVFFVVERIIPANRCPSLKEIGADIRANLIFFFINPTALFVGAWLAQPLARYVGGPQIHLNLQSSLGESIVGGFALAFVPMLVFDFFYYWYHRFQHKWGWLWEVHRLHHSEAALSVLTSYRHHWLEEFFRSFFIFLPMNWLISIIPPASVAATLLIRQWNGFFHSNIRISLGRFTGVVAGPQYHRIHHSIEPKHFDKNFAAFFPIWDWMFGTYWKPETGEWPQTGLSDTNGLWTTRELLLAPFQAWLRPIESRIRRRRQVPELTR